MMHVVRVMRASPCAGIDTLLETCLSGHHSPARDLGPPLLHPSTSAAWVTKLRSTLCLHLSLSRARSPASAPVAPPATIHTPPKPPPCSTTHQNRYSRACRRALPIRPLCPSASAVSHTSPSSNSTTQSLARPSFVPLPPQSTLSRCYPMQ
jgi:hypothetical protein